MNLYEQFVQKQSEIVEVICQKDKLEMELTELKREIFKKHAARFKEKPVGKTTLKDVGFEIVYNRTEKITVLTSVMEQDKFKHDVIVTKESKTTKIELDKKEYKKLSDEEKEKLNKYLSKELSKPTLSVKVIDEK